MKKIFCRHQGKTPNHIRNSILEKIPIDKTFTGVHIDSGKIFVTIISENNGTKTLLAQREFAAKDRRLNHSEDPNNYAEACQEAIDLAEEDLSAYGDIYNRAYKSVSKEILLLLQKKIKKFS